LELNFPFKFPFNGALETFYLFGSPIFIFGPFGIYFFQVKPYLRSVTRRYSPSEGQLDSLYSHCQQFVNKYSANGGFKFTFPSFG
jgi:hypothetical protein